MICFYCTSFLSLKHVVHIIPNIIMMAVCHNDQVQLLDILSDSVDSCRENTRILVVLKKTNKKKNKQKKQRHQHRHQHRQQRQWQNRMFLKWPFGFRCSAGIDAVWTDRNVFLFWFFFLWSDKLHWRFFYIFVCVVLLWSLCLCCVPVYVVFLHEANVAVDYSFSLLSLCDIVYWETKKKKHFKCEQKRFYFKRGYCDTVCYCHSSWSS